LGRLRADPDWRVRYAVAERAGKGVLTQRQDDSDEAVREIVQSRLRPQASVNRQ
ncbi:MAG TPA: LRV FeS4 cluster domain-containing protein, partial [Betaproteobacteria bacterium]|nr:LRV FeS4 cluster domain-containing protein [Betaproteobacteria bacterium]